jgi:hypothetical protein
MGPILIPKVHSPSIWSLLDQLTEPINKVHDLFRGAAMENRWSVSVPRSLLTRSDCVRQRVKCEKVGHIWATKLTKLVAFSGEQREQGQ